MSQNTSNACCPNCGEREALRLACVAWLSHGSFRVELNNGQVVLHSPPRVVCTVKPYHELVAQGVGRCIDCGYEGDLTTFGIQPLSTAFYREIEEDPQQGRNQRRVTSLQDLMERRRRRLAEREALQEQGSVIADEDPFEDDDNEPDPDDDDDYEEDN